MLGELVANMQPRTAHGVIHFEIVQTVRHPRGLCQAAQPFAIGERIGRKIQNHTDTGLKHVDHKGTHHTPNSLGVTYVIRYLIDLAGIER